jgi:REP element-mobilizing transposase RayT
MVEQEKWQWQEPGTTWKGVGLYHITLTVTSRQPLLGSLIIPDNDPSKAIVKRTALGNALVDCLLSIASYHPEVQVLHFCLMPDHLHAVLYVRRTMPKGIRMVVRGFWQGAKKLGRAFSAASSIAPNAIRENYQEDKLRNYQEDKLRNNQEGMLSYYQGGVKNLKEETVQLEAISASLCKQMGNEAYYQLEPVFTEIPFIRSMGHNTQLPNTIRYIDMNPQRLATKRLKPGFFRVQKDIMIGKRSYDGVGNTTLLMAEHFETVHVRRVMVEEANHGNDEPLRNYMNSCIMAARKGVIMVSPFISPYEKQVMLVMLREKLPFIYLSDNGFREYYKPTDVLFDACASGRLLILSPWTYDASKRHISREDCIALNAMAEEICNKETAR